MQTEPDSPPLEVAQFRSILFDDANAGTAIEGAQAPEFFRDLNLDQVVESTVANRDEYNLKPFFHTPLTNPRSVNYRYEVFRDLENQELLGYVRAFAQEMRSMRNYLTQEEKFYYQRQKQSWFLDAVDIYCKAIGELARILQRTDLNSRGFLGFRAYLSHYAESDDFTSLVAETQKLKSDLAEIRYSLYIQGKRITVSRYDSEPDYGATVLHTFEKFKQGTAKQYQFDFSSFPEMDHVEAAILDIVSELYPGIFASLDEYCIRRRGYFDDVIKVFDREVQFYMAWIEYIGRFKPFALNFCYPTVTNRSKEVLGNEIFDLALADKLMRGRQGIVTNDFYLNDPERIIVVSGPNQGGKTTFARTFGQMHYLASIGCPVQGREARLFLFDKLYTHFEREEDIGNLSGKLEDELRRIRNILDQATPNSMLIMNESFLSTTLQDALFLSKKVMQRIIGLDILCVSVTFLDELASLSEQTVSMVSTVNPADPALRTFKVVRRSADGLAYAAAIAEKYRLTHDAVAKRILESHARELSHGQQTTDLPTTSVGFMKAFLMHRERDFGTQERLPSNSADLIKDLELDTLFNAMSAGDAFLRDVAKKAVLASLREPEAIVYRQHILADCLDHPQIVRQIYSIAVSAIEQEKKVWGWLSRYPESVLHRSIEVLRMFLGVLKSLRQMADEHRAKFRSEGYTTLFTMLIRELSDDYLSEVEGHLRCLEFRKGLLMSAELGRGSRGTNYILRKPHETRRSWFERVQNWVENLPRRDRTTFYYELADRDESGFRTLSDLRGRGIGHVAAALAQSTDHILSFFRMLQLELGFYIGCLNLRDRLAAKSEPLCMPQPLPMGAMSRSIQGLYDVSLSLTMNDRVVGNNLSADGKMLVVITGANRGGKSTLLRSIGLAQLMMQCGMFVPSESFRAAVCDGVFTHFKREEDATMKSGKLDEELSRMSSLVDGIAPNSLMLFNESFASTNEREGSEIARQITRALLETGVKVFYVTHLFDLAQSFFLARMKDGLFLRAQRLSNGQRTFRVIEGEPLPTSYGQDLYIQIFENAEDKMPPVSA